MILGVRFGVPGILRRGRPKQHRPLLSHAKGGGGDVLEAAFARAALDSAEYYEEHMLTARAFGSDLDLLSYAVSLAPLSGLIIETGVASGRTINHVASCAPNRNIFGFDSFDGLPEDWRTGFAKGAFAGGMPKVADNVTLVQGLFADTLPSFLEKHSDSVALLHIDCDLYSSTATVLTHVRDRLQSGTVIVFDEYFNYPGWRKHEFKAFREFAEERRLQYRYVGFVPSHQQVCVVIE
jgi:methyltransferase family protein